MNVNIDRKLDVVITGAARTAIGGFMGGLSNVPAHILGSTVIKKILEQSGVANDEVCEVIMGQVLTAASGQNPARQASVLAGLAHNVPAWTINQVCGSGLRAVALAYQAIKCGDAKIIIAGGQENMSASPHAMALRAGVKMGNATQIDTMVHDGLWDAFNNYHMGMTAENIAKQFNISRQDQDALAFESQEKAAAAIAAGRFVDEIVPVVIKDRKGDIVIDKDEHPRVTTLEKLAALKPAFDKDGSVTAGNASGLNDGAAALMVMSRAEAEKRGLKVLATIKSWSHAGVDPAIMGTGPITATQKCLAKAGWTVADLDLVESNEAFAAQALSVTRALGFAPEKLNVNGGAIALGHPIGASGARVLTSLIHEMNRRDAKKGLATLCIGGGMGVAMAIERD